MSANENLIQLKQRKSKVGANRLKISRHFGTHVGDLLTGRGVDKPEGVTSQVVPLLVS